jgi:hypothetical protein
MSDKPGHIDLDGIDFDSLSAEEQILIHRLQGKIGHGDYTRGCHKWLDKIPEEEVEVNCLKCPKSAKTRTKTVSTLFLLVAPCFLFYRHISY